MKTSLRSIALLLLVGAALSPLRASTLAGGFGALQLEQGAPPVPSGCGREVNHCSCSSDMGVAPAPSGGFLDATLVTFAVTNSGNSAYVIDGLTNPTLTLTRGQTYTFNINATNHPFFIKTVQGTGAGNAYNNGVTGNGTQVGTVTFVVPLDAPDTLFYNCGNHFPMTAQINVIPEPSVLAAAGALGLLALAARRRARR